MSHHLEEPQVSPKTLSVIVWAKDTPYGGPILDVSVAWKKLNAQGRIGLLGLAFSLPRFSCFTRFNVMMARQ